GSLESGEGGPKLFVRSAIDTSADRTQEGVEGKADHPIFGGPRFVVAVQELDVDILIESAGQAIARTGQHAPPPAALRGEGDCRVLGGVAQPEDGKRFERPVE